MTTPPEDPRSPVRWCPLDATQRRVLGVLIEKAKTTPAAYPMTLNAIVTGSNQKNNRDPLTQLDETDVSEALHALEKLQVVNEIDWMGRSSKYKHHAYEWLGVNKVELAVMTELLLRGEQTLGDLRARAARMEPIADLTALKPIVDGLLERGLMVELTPAGRGQIVSHRLYMASELAGLSAKVAGSIDRPAPTVSPAAARSFAEPENGSRSSLASELVALREEVQQLRERIEALEAMDRPTDT